MSMNGAGKMDIYRQKNKFWPPPPTICKIKLKMHQILKYTTWIYKILKRAESSWPCIREWFLHIILKEQEQVNLITFFFKDEILCALKSLLRN